MNKSDIIGQKAANIFLHNLMHTYVLFTLIKITVIYNGCRNVNFSRYIGVVIHIPESD